MPNKVYTDHVFKMVLDVTIENNDYELVPELERVDGEARCLEVYEELYD